MSTLNKIINEGISNIFPNKIKVEAELSNVKNNLKRIIQENLYKI